MVVDFWELVRVSSTSIESLIYNSQKPNRAFSPIRNKVSERIRTFSREETAKAHGSPSSIRYITFYVGQRYLTNEFCSSAIIRHNGKLNVKTVEISRSLRSGVCNPLKVKTQAFSLGRTTREMERSLVSKRDKTLYALPFCILLKANRAFSAEIYLLLQLYESDFFFARKISFA